MDGLIGPIHDPALANGHHVKEHWSRGVFLTKKTYQIYELKDCLLKGNIFT